MSDEIAAITTGTKVTMRAPFPLTLQSPYMRCSLTTAGTTTTTLDVTVNGTSIFSTLPTLASGATTNSAPKSVSTTVISDDAEIKFVVSGAGASAAGLKATLYFLRN